MPDRWCSRTVAFLLVCSSLLASCASTEPLLSERRAGTVPEDDVVSPVVVSRFPDGYSVVGAAHTASAGPTHGFDILHASVDMSFDYVAPMATGKVGYSLIVLRGGLSELRFRSDGLKIDAVEMTRGEATVRSEFAVIGSWLVVTPGAPLRRSDTLLVSVRYRATGKDQEPPGGIRFVDPAADDPSLPTEVWCCERSQGTATWLPVVDDPGEVMTFDLRLEVEDSLTTIASGQLVDQQILDSGRRVDLWSLDLDQPPDRVGFAIGSYLLIADEYVSPVGKRSLIVTAVDPRLEPLVDAAFSVTPEMIAIVERRTAVEYPFADYKQVVVSSRSPLARGLAGLSLFDDGFLTDGRALPDYDADGALMRTIASQWYGSWVGVASRSQTPVLNAIERLFQTFYHEDESGRQGLEEDLLRARARYFEEAKRMRRPIVVDGLDLAMDSEAHSVEKSSLVVHQLGEVIGDEPWWRALRDFTARGGGRKVTIDELRESMEQASRRPLTDYFEQWFMEPGHPELLVDHGYDGDLGVYTLRIRQVQDSSRFPTYDIETTFSVHFQSAPAYRERVHISSRDTTLRLGVSGRITFARFDASDRLLADVRERKPMEQWLYQCEADESVAGRLDAVSYLSRGAASAETRDALMRVADQDPSSIVRSTAVYGLENYVSSGLVLRFLFDRTAVDPAPEGRAAAIRVLSQSGDPSVVGALRGALQDPSDEVVAEAVRALGQAAPASFWTSVGPVLEIRSPGAVVERALLKVLEQAPVAASEPYLRNLLEPTNSARVRVAALDAFRHLSSLGREWKEQVRSVAQSLLADRNAEVRDQARRVLKSL